MNILFATTLIPHGRSSGGEVISLAVVRGLREIGCRVTVIGYLRPDDRTAVDAETIVVERRPIETAGSALRMAGWMLRSLLTRTPYTSTKYQSAAYGPLLRRLVEDGGIDAVLLDHTQMAWLLDWIPAGTRIWTLMHNAESDLYDQGARHAAPAARLVYRRESRLLRRLEARLGARADRIWVLSEGDGTLMRSVTGSASVTLLPVMPEENGEPARPAQASADIAMLATWTWRPNEDALRWFFDRVYPLLPGGTTVEVAGRGAQWLSGRFPGVTYRGFVADAAAFLASARIVAVATRHGSGVETKMLTAIATGCRVIATSAATRGLGALPATVTIADEPQAFSRRIIDAIRGSSLDASAGALWRRARRERFLAALRREQCLAATATCAPGPASQIGFDLAREAAS